MRSILGKYGKQSMTSLSFIAVALVGLAMSTSTVAHAQAIYHFSSGPAPLQVGLSTGPTPYYTGSQPITMTVQLDKWLAPDSCVDISTLPGYRLIGSDGVHSPLDSADAPPVGGQFMPTYIATDPNGIPFAWVLQISQLVAPDIHNTVRTARPAGSATLIAAGCTGPAALDFLEHIQGSSAEFGSALTTGNFNAEATLTLSTLISTSPTALTGDLINLFQLGVLPANHKILGQLQDVVSDLTQRWNDSCRDLSTIMTEVNSHSGNPTSTFSPSQATFINTTLEMIASEEHCVALIPFPIRHKGHTETYGTFSDHQAD